VPLLGIALVVPCLDFHGTLIARLYKQGIYDRDRWPRGLHDSIIPWMSPNEEKVA